MANSGELFFKGIGKNIEKVGKQVAARLEADRKEAIRRITSATDLIYKVARTRRPYIYVTGPGRGSTYHPNITKRQAGKIGARKVSDPNASYGVPVKTGNLKDAIKKKVEEKFTHIVGTVYVDQAQAPYAKFLEFGTSKAAPRPFMRQARKISEDAVNKIIFKPVKK